MSFTLITSGRFADHLTPPGHPESVARAEVMDVVAARWAARGASLVAPRPATSEELERVHAPAYLDAIAATAGRAVALDADTYASPDSHEVARLAAGAAIVAVERAMGAAPLGHHDAPSARGGVAGARAFALVRPPGHHAEADRAMGFCLYNNVAVAAAHALALGARRVAVVDYDVHHGNGTQSMFYDDPRVLFVSTHQYPYYPGTGDATEVGRGEGTGFTVNVPLEVGATDADYDVVFKTIVEPVVRQFGPDLILVSAGFDAHERDPLGGMRLSTEGYAVVTNHLRRLADACCDGRLVLVTEGGYHLPSLRACLDAAIEAVRESDAMPPTADRSVPASARDPGSRRPTHRARAAIDRVRAAQRRYWPGL